MAREDTSDGHAPQLGEPPIGPGTRIGEYVVEGLLGSGTFGIVYRGIQPLIGKQVAIKLLGKKYSADPTVVSRFVAEARAVNQIAHRNIIDIFSFGQFEDGRHYYVMELLDGETLEEAIRRQGGHLRPDELFPILRGLARALDAAHAAGIAHRDLKPANVFLTRDEDGRPSPKLLDFGIAKLLTDDLPRQHTTASGAAVGTPDYMSPEQCRGPDVDHRTDIYAFGVMAYQLLTGHLPFRGDTVVEVLMKHMTEDPPPPSLKAAHLPSALDAPILAMLAKRPEDRPASLYEAVVALETAARGAGITFPSSTDTARTFVSGPQPDLSDQGAKPARVLLMAVVAIGAAVAAVPLFLESDDGPAGSAMPASNEGSSGSEPSAPAEFAPPPVEESTPVDPTVRIYFDGLPDGTRILSADGSRLGDAPGPIRLARSETPVELRFVATGYRSRRRALRPVESTTVSVRLTRVRRKPSKTAPPKASKPGKDDLEVPTWD